MVRSIIIFVEILAHSLVLDKLINGFKHNLQHTQNVESLIVDKLIRATANKGIFYHNTNRRMCLFFMSATFFYIVINTVVNLEY